MNGENVVLKGITGGPAVGKEYFFARDKELADLIEKVTRGDSLYISAPRRIGKTSLMKQAITDLEKDGNLCFYYDIGGESPSKWIYELAMDMYKHLAIKKSVVAAIKNFLHPGKLSASKILKSIVDSEQWDKQGDNFFEALYDSCPVEKRVVIFLDELAVMIQNMQDKLPKEERSTEAHRESTRFLVWFRSIRQRYHGKISFVIASSIGLHPLLERLKLSKHINDLANFSLDAWEAPIAIECILALARGKKINISPQTAELMTEMIGWCSPYYVQAFFDSAYDHLFREKRGPYSKQELSDIYFEYLIRGNDISPTLSHMKERLSKCLSKLEFDIAKQILNKLAQNDGFIAKPEVKNIENEDSVRYVIKILKHDGYIREVKDGYRFLSNVIRDWWRNGYGN